MVAIFRLYTRDSGAMLITAVDKLRGHGGIKSQQQFQARKK
jgi:hypothetical protein